MKSVGKERILLNCNEVKVLPVAGHYEVSYLNGQGERVTLKTKKVISTIGAHHLDQVMPFIEPALLSKVTALHYTKVLEIVLGFKEWKGMKLDAFGALIPFTEKRDLLGVLFMSALFSGRAPEGGALFSIFMGGGKASGYLSVA